MKVDKNTVITAAAIGAVILVIILIVNGANLLKRFFGLFGRIRFDHDETPLLPGGEISPDFDPAPHVARLTEVLYSALLNGAPRCQAYKQLMKLTDNEFIIVCNEYYKTTGFSLRSDMDRTWQSGCSVFFTQWDNRVYKRMDRLKVIG